jgi:polyketide biosynthesis acyl carrier protein
VSDRRLAAPAVWNAVVEAIAEVLPNLAAHEVTADRSLQELGADSIDRIEIIQSLRDRLDVQHSLSSFADLPDIGALVAFLARAESQ